MILIALHGLPGSGKDTFADLLVKSGAWSKVSFAAPLKRGLATMLEIPISDIENPLTKNEPSYKFGKSIRYMLQTLGTEWGRNLIADNIWVDIARENILYQFDHKQNVVITDLRFENEAKMIKDLGGYIINIKRKRSDMVVNDIGIPDHQSNSGISVDNIDYTIYNDGTHQEFLYNSAIVVKKIMKDI